MVFDSSVYLSWALAVTLGVDMAVQFGMRCSLDSPDAYVDSSLVDCPIVIESCQHNEIE